MNEIYQAKLVALSQDELMLNAINEIFKEKIEANKPMIEKTDNDKVLGEKYRAYEQSKFLINAVMADIETFNNKKVKSTEINRAI